MRLNRIFDRASGTQPAAEGPAISGSGTVTCPNCGGPSNAGGECPACTGSASPLPGWALSGRERRFITRRRLIGSGIALVLLLILVWLNYPFLPDYRILLFNRPTTDISSNSVAGQWSMAGGDLTQRKVVRTDFESTALPVGRLKWSVQTGQGTRSGPIVVDGRVYLGAHFKLLALDAASGDVVWEQVTSGPVQTSPALAGNRLYAGFLDHRLRAMDPDSGNILWEFKSGDIITTSPVVHNGILYFGAWDKKQYALDAATGEVIWTYAATETIGSHAPIRDGVMAVADKGGQIHLLNARTGQNRLIYRTPKSTNAAPVIAHDHVYFAAGGRLYAIDAREKEVPGQYQFKRVWAQFWLWQVPGVPRPAGQQGGKWRFSPDGADSSIVASPAVANTRLYVGDLQGRLYAVDPLSGAEQWRFQAEGGIYASPLVIGDTVYIATQTGNLYAVDGATGQSRWQVSLGEGVNEPMAFAGGVIYLRTADGALHAVE